MCITIAENTKQQCNRAIQLFGESQVLVTIEEMAELTQALLKYYNRNRREPEDIAHVVDECADVCITLYQAIKVLGLGEQIFNRIAEKGDILKRKLDKYESNKN